MAELTVIRTDRGTEPLLVMALVGSVSTRHQGYAPSSTT